MRMFDIIKKVSTFFVKNKVVGNGSVFGSVYNIDGVTPFIDADLPTNCVIECEFEIDSFSLAGIFGFDNGAADGFYIQTRDIDKQFIASVWGTQNIFSTTGVVGEVAKIKLVIVGSSYDWKFNDAIVNSGTFTKTLSNKELQLLTKGDTTDVSNHNIVTFKITNTDTDEVIISFDGFQNYIDLGGNQAKVFDTTGNYCAIFTNTYPGWNIPI